MEQTKEKLEAHITALEKALDTLTKAVSEPCTDLMRDATIKRFEYVFELSWKTMRLASTHMGYSCNSPREAIKQVFKLGWVDNPDSWFDALEARNNSSHTYNEKLADEVYEVAKKFPKVVNKLLSALKGL